LDISELFNQQEDNAQYTTPEVFSIAPLNIDKNGVPSRTNEVINYTAGTELAM